MVATSKLMPGRELLQEEDVGKEGSRGGGGGGRIRGVKGRDVYKEKEEKMKER